MAKSKTRQMSLKIPDYMYRDLVNLRKVLKVQDDSKAIRFCITYALVALDKLGREQITEALAIAFGESLFSNGDDDDE